MNGLENKYLGCGSLCVESTRTQLYRTAFSIQCSAILWFCGLFKMQFHFVYVHWQALPDLQTSPISLYHFPYHGWPALLSNANQATVSQIW